MDQPGLTKNSSVLKYAKLCITLKIAQFLDLLKIKFRIKEII